MLGLSLNSLLKLDVYGCRADQGAKASAAVLVNFANVNGSLK